MIRRKGRFGVIGVRDTPEAREIAIDGQIQGGALLLPSAHAVNSDMSDDQPGPIASAPYALGWLMGGVQAPRATCLMIGLGCGSGATQLLYNFPDTDVTVVEIDPVMVQMALSNFPLLEHYMDLGRLNVVIDDATTYLTEHYDVWDFACADAYTGDPRLVADYLPLLCDRADNVYLNVIDELGGESMSSVSDVLAIKGKPVAEVFKAIPPAYVDRSPYDCCSNWIMTTQDPIWSDLHDFVPFAQWNDFNTRRIRNMWDQLLASALSSVV